jgi:hypothetical protein
MNIHSELGFVTPFGDTTIEFHLAEISDENGIIEGYGIWAQPAGQENGSLIAKFDPNMTIELGATFMVMFQTAQMFGHSDRVAEFLNTLVSEPEPDVLAPVHTLIIPDTANVETINK